MLIYILCVSKCVKSVAFFCCQTPVHPRPTNVIIARLFGPSSLEPVPEGRTYLHLKESEQPPEPLRLPTLPEGVTLPPEESV